MPRTTTTDQRLSDQLGAHYAEMPPIQPEPPRLRRDGKRLIALGTFMGGIGGAVLVTAGGLALGGLSGLEPFLGFVAGAIWGGGAAAIRAADYPLLPGGRESRGSDVSTSEPTR